MIVDRSVLRQNMISGILDTVAHNVARKNKNLAFTRLEKSLNKLVIQRRTSKWNQQFCLPWQAQFAEKISKQQQFQLISSMLKGILEALFTRLGLEVAYTATAEIA